MGAVAQEQLSFSLRPSEPFAAQYFVVHSGVSDAWNGVTKICQQLSNDSSYFQLVYLWGHNGAGKTHLVEACRAKYLSPALREEKSAVVKIPIADAAHFIALYERLRTSGGIVFVEGEVQLDQAASDPHIISRLLNGAAFEVSYPTEAELRPLVLSLLERYNLRLSEASLEYLLRRLPLDPLSFANIFAKINDVSLARNDSARLGIIREILSTPASGDVNQLPDGKIVP